MRKKLIFAVIAIFTILLLAGGLLYGKSVYSKIADMYVLSHFPKYKITGESVSGEEIYITAHTDSYEHGWLMIIDSNGKELWRSKDLGSYAYSFRKYEWEDGTVRYAWQQSESILPKSKGGILATHIVIADENFDVVQDDVVPLPYGSLTKDTWCENHDYLLLGEDHFVLTSSCEVVVEEIGEAYNSHVFNNIIQEQKAGVVVWQLETIDYPELFEYSLLNNNYSEYTDESGKCGDYAHINSVDFDTAHRAVIVSFRGIGIVSFDYDTKEINWVIGRARNDIAGVQQNWIPYLQHCARVQADGSILLFDNSGCEDNVSRIQRFWIDPEAKALVQYKEYYGNQPRSPYMGCVMLIDDDTETMMISYGGNFSNFALEEYDFSHESQNMVLTYNAGFDLYAFSVGTTKNNWA